VGPDRDDLVFRYRTHAAAWRLNQPDLRVPGAFGAVTPGDSVDIAIWRDAAGYCAAFDGHRTCRLGFTAGHGWTIALYPESLPRWLKVLLGAGWLGAIALLASFWGPGWLDLVLAGGLAAAALALLAPAAGLLTTPATEWLSAAAGLAGGVWLRRALGQAVRAAGQRGDV
jgi:hypothetical protein